MRRMRQFQSILLLCAMAACVLLGAANAAAQEVYKKPPKEVLDVLNAPSPPVLSISPTRDFALQYEPVRYPPIADLAQPMLRLAGVRMNPANNGQHSPPRIANLVLRRIADGSEKKVAMAAGAGLSFPSTGTLINFPGWAPNGKQFYLTSATTTAIHLLVVNTATAKAHPITGIKLNTTLGAPCRWMPDSKSLLCLAVPAGRGAPPKENPVPAGPNVQENFGRAAPAPTFQDMLKNPHDADLFDYYATSQLMLIDAASGKATPVGKPAVFATLSVAPGGKYILVSRLKRPYSYQLPFTGFTQEAEVWTLAGEVAYKVASVPLAENVPLGGVRTGPRNYQWVPTEPSRLIWVEALDEGNPRNRVPHRDKIMSYTVPSKMAPVELMKTEHRFSGASFGERGDFLIYREFDRARNWQRVWFKHKDGEPKLVWDMSAQERYKDPGNPVFKTLPTGQAAIVQQGDDIFLSGAGATPEGDRPFLDRFNTKTLKSERLWRCGDTSYETLVALLAEDGSKFMTRYESLTEPPNYYVRTTAGGRDAFTKFADPAPQLRGIKKQLVKYKRADGQDLSFTLYLPPDYKQGERRPAVFWAYPLEFTGSDVAGQVTGSTNRFTSIGGYSHLFFLLEGYVVMDDVSIPIVGDPETVNNTYVEQLVSSAKAAIDKANEMGVIDPDRIGAGGHSYGAFMTANLLAHSDLFRAGIARSGAYNRTLTPFGFQAERRTFWEATETYIKMSPFAHANKIKEPILLIHGEADNNSGTFPIQSERMFAALKGNGGNVRYVTLPFEAHGYAARESTEHTLWEMINWFDKYVKKAPPRGQQSATAQ